MPYFRRNSNPLQSANCHPGDFSNFKCKLVNMRVVTGTGRKPYVPRRPAQMARFDGEILKVFQADLTERKKRFPSWPGAKKNCNGFEFRRKYGILVGPGPRLIQMTSPHFVL